MQDTKFKHTPGPWFVESYNNHVSVVGDIKYTQQGTPAMISHVCDVNNGYAHPEEWVKQNEANARLVASAPDLLDALKAIYHRAYQDTLESEYELKSMLLQVRKLAKDAIAKAAGKEVGHE